MWNDLDAILELTLGTLGVIVAIVIALTYLEDGLDPDGPRGLEAVRAWWRNTR